MSDEAQVPSDLRADLRALVFTLAGQGYALEAGRVQELLRSASANVRPVRNLPTSVPVEGLLKRRNQLMPVVDLRRVLGIRGEPPAETCIIIVRLSVGPVGLVADAASERLWIKASDIAPPPPLIATAAQPYFSGVAHLGERVLMVFDPEQLFPPDVRQQMGELGATHTNEAEADEAALARATQRRLVTFEIGDELYGIPITDVAEIREPLPITPLPPNGAPQHVLGLINLRGTILPVIDLRRRFDFPIHPAHPDNRLLILRGPGYLVALWIEAVHGLARLPLTAFQPAPPKVARLDSEYYEQVAMVDGRMVIELNARKLLEGTAARRM
jgi:purine-binding chemotaxis protein CheW